MGRYSCGRCGAAVTKDTHTCPHCGAGLAGIRCSHCGFTGSRVDFPLDVCPRCHRRIQVDSDVLTLSPGCLGAGRKLLVGWGLASLAVFVLIVVVVLAFIVLALIVSVVQAII